jgi:hypothetical protein
VLRCVESKVHRINRDTLLTIIYKEMEKEKIFFTGMEAGKKQSFVKPRPAEWHSYSAFGLVLLCSSAEALIATWGYIFQGGYTE